MAAQVIAWVGWRKARRLSMSPGHLPPTTWRLLLKLKCALHAARVITLPYAAAGALLLLAGCTASMQAVAPTDPAQVGPVRSGSIYLKGYLQPSELPDSLALLPPPPAAQSAAFAADEAAHRSMAAQQGSARGAFATRDAELRFPQAAGAFACALGVPISADAMPNLNMLLRRILTDAGRATYKAKDHYRRLRPFVTYQSASCTPGEEAMLTKDGSYPSGHAAIGWTWALLPTELAPQHGDALLQRGWAFAQSRGICGVHWQSDIEAGRAIGAATVARLHADPVFTTQLAAARGEIAAAIKSGARPTQDCAAEQAALTGTSR